MSKKRSSFGGRSLLKLAFMIVGGILFVIPVNVAAIGSNNYAIDEDFIGGSGTTESSSTNYTTRDSQGAPVTGDSGSTNYQTQSGPQTTNDPTLTFTINSSSVSLGTLSTSLTRTGTATFEVLNYTSYGYAVNIFGATPSNGSHNLNALSSASASAAGTEQFGINLVANTSPTTFGADPQQVPDTTFSFGLPASGYDTANLYKYVSGNNIATAVKSSGRTAYTISYIANISNNTPRGSYSGTQTLICTGTY